MADTQKKEKKSTAKKGRVKKIVLIVLLVITLLAVAIATPFLIKIARLKADAEAMVAASTDATFKSEKTTLIYDCNGEKIANMVGGKILYYVELDKIPKDLQNAFLVMEDRKFYEHRGVDLMAIIRATIANYNANAIEQGASTITQQLARNVFLTQEVTWERKIQEMYVALALERTYSKEKILEYYLNNIYFSNGYYGVEAAAQGYFGRSVDALSLSEMVFLATIPNNPSKYDPLVHFENTMARRNIILGELLSEGYISRSAYDEAVAAKIELTPKVTAKYNYVETYVKYCATRELMRARGFRFRYDFNNEEDYNIYMENYYAYYSKCQQELFAGGYSIYTSIDMDKQELLQGKVDGVLARDTQVSDSGVYKLQGAAVSIDNKTGNVVAIVGGRSQDMAGYTLNRAYQSYRQAGSAIKPINVYMPYLCAGKFPSSIVNDSPIAGGPVNWDGQYLGNITVTDALRLSRNTPAWRVCEELTPAVCSKYLLQLEFKRIYMDKDNVAGAIGGFTYGVTAEEMAGAYAAIANDGVFRYTTCVKRIENAAGSTVVDTATREQYVYPVNQSRMMQAILKRSHVDGTANQARLDTAIAGSKTGTTNDDKDYWYVGFTRYYTTSVWVGYDDPKPIGVWGEAAHIFKLYMDEIHRDLPVLDFEDYDHTLEDQWLGKDKEQESSSQNIKESEGKTEPAETASHPGNIPGGEVDATGSGHESGEWDNPAGGGDVDASFPSGGSDLPANPDVPGEWDAPAGGGDSNAGNGVVGEWDAR